MVYTELEPRRQQFHVAPSMPALKYNHFDRYLKRKKEKKKKAIKTCTELSVS